MTDSHQSKQLQKQNWLEVMFHQQLNALRRQRQSHHSNTHPPASQSNANAKRATRETRRYRYSIMRCSPIAVSCVRLRHRRSDICLSLKHHHTSAAAIHALIAISCTPPCVLLPARLSKVRIARWSFIHNFLAVLNIPCTRFDKAICDLV